MKTRQQPQGSGVHFSLLKNHRAMAAFSKEPARVLPEKKSSSLLPRVHLYRAVHEPAMWPLHFHDIIRIAGHSSHWPEWTIYRNHRLPWSKHSCPQPRLSHAPPQAVFVIATSGAPSAAGSAMAVATPAGARPGSHILAQGPRAMQQPLLSV